MSTHINTYKRMKNNVYLYEWIHASHNQGVQEKKNLNKMKMKMKLKAKLRYRMQNEPTKWISNPLNYGFRLANITQIFRFEWFLTPSSYWRKTTTPSDIYQACITAIVHTYQKTEKKNEWKKNEKLFKCIIERLCVCLYCKGRNICRW